MFIYEYTYGFKADVGMKHASVQQCKNVIRMKSYVVLYSQNEIALEKAVQISCTLRLVQAVNLEILFQILNAVSILK